MANSTSLTAPLTVAMTLALGGCTTHTSTFHIPEKLGAGNTVLTSADLRGMNTVPVGPRNPGYGRIVPTQITCVEPSADLAKAISSSIGTGATFSFSGLFGSGGSGDGAASNTRSVSEAAAQMTNRLAVIQLLRDALYRACEAYANGALTATSYAVLLSRYDDVMVTMLLGELAAGDFSGELASLGGSSGASASAVFQQQRVDAEKAEGKANDDKKSADARVKEQEQAVAAAQSEFNTVSANTEATTAQKTDAQSKLSEAEIELARRKTTADLMDKALSVAQATASSSRALATAKGASGGEPGQGTERAEIAKQLREMQRKYVENINADALVVACIAALDRPDNERTQLSSLCRGQMESGGLLANLLKAQYELLQIAKSHSIDEQNVAAVEDHAGKMRRIRNALDQLEGSMPGKPGPRPDSNPGQPGG